MFFFKNSRVHNFLFLSKRLKNESLHSFTITKQENFFDVSAHAFLMDKRTTHTLLDPAIYMLEARNVDSSHYSIMEFTVEFLKPEVIASFLFSLNSS